MKSIIVIPARMQSTRLPRKMLLAETGKPLIQHTCEAALRSKLVEGVIVATDHQDIVDAVESFGGRAMLTAPDHASGTDRVAEVARKFPDAELIVNVQGDEPEISAAAIDRAVGLLREHADCSMSTLAVPIRDREQLNDPACVKVVCGANGQALYFSRSVIPHPRQWNDDLLVQEPPAFLQHIGLYVYRRDFLLEFATLSPAPLEQTESLEQLRALHHGHSIAVGVIDESTAGIDTAEDYRRFVERTGSTK